MKRKYASVRRTFGTGFEFYSLPPTLKRVRVRVTLRLAVYRQSVHLGAKPLVAQDQSFFFN
jgi:hypothetical protein